MVASRGICLWKVLHCRFQTVLCLEGPVLSLGCPVWSPPKGVVFGTSCIVAYKGFCLWMVLHCRFQRVLSLEGPVLSLECPRRIGGSADGLIGGSADLRTCGLADRRVGGPADRRMYCYCCNGEHIWDGSVAVAAVGSTSGTPMLLWLQWEAHPGRQCCCGCSGKHT